MYYYFLNTVRESRDRIVGSVDVSEELVTRRLQQPRLDGILYDTIILRYNFIDKVLGTTAHTHIV